MTRVPVADGDKYGLRHLAEHLYLAKRYTELHQLLTRNWMAMKYEQLGSNLSLTHDLDLAIEVIVAQQSLGFETLAHHCLLYAYLGTLTSALPPEVLSTLTQIGRLDLACDNAELLPDVEKQSKAYRLIGTALVAQNNRKEANRIFFQALATIEQISDLQTRANELSEIVPALVQLEGLAELERALVLALEITKAQAEVDVLHHIAMALARIGGRESLKQALTLASTTIEDERTRARALGIIVAVMGQVGDESGLEQAFAYATTLTDGQAQAIVLEYLVQALTNVGDKDKLQKLLAAARIIKDPPDLVHEQRLSRASKIWLAKMQGKVLDFEESVGGELSATITKSIATAFAQMGAFDQAKTVVNEIQVRAIKEATLAAIAAELARSRRIDKALSGAKSIDDPEICTVALNQISGVAAQMQMFDEALQIARAIEEPKTEVEALLSIAQSLVETGENSRGVKIAKEAVAMVDKAFGSQYQKAGCCLRQAILILARADEVNQALALVDVEQFRWVYDKASVIGEVAKILAEKRDKGGLNRILVSVRAIWDEQDRAEAIDRVAQAMVQIEDITGLNQALQTARSITNNDSWYWHAQSAVIEALAAVGAVDQAMREAEKIDMWWVRARVYGRIGQALVTAGNQEKAAEAVKRALNALTLYRHPSKQAMWLSTLATALARVGSFDHLNQLFDLAAAINLDSAKAQAFKGLAIAFSQAKDKAGLQQVLDATVRMRDETDLSVALSNIAWATVSVEDKESLYRILSEVQKLWDESDRAYILRDLVQTFAMVEEREGVEQIISLADNLEQKRTVAIALSGIARALTQLGELERAIATVQQIKDWQHKAPTLLGMMRILAAKKAGEEIDKLSQAGFNEALEKLVDLSDATWLNTLEALIAAAQKEKINGLVDQAKATAEAANEPRKAAILGNLVVVLTQIGKVEAAVQAMEQALVTTEVIELGKDKVDALTGLTYKLFQVGLTNEASHLANRVLTVAEEMVVGDNKVAALCQAANAMFQIGEMDRAVGTLRTAFDIARRVNWEQVYNVLESGANILAELDQGVTLWHVHEVVQEINSWWENV